MLAPAAVLAGILFGCERPLVHPCKTDVDCAVGWSCVAGTCASTATDGGTGRPGHDATPADDHWSDGPARDSADGAAPDGSARDDADGNAPDGFAGDDARRCAPYPGGGCAIAGSCQQGRCDPATGDCVYSTAPDGTPCDDEVACTANDMCTGGFCSGVRVGIVVSDHTATRTCPPIANAIGGFVTATCVFEQTLSWNIQYTGTVFLVSHLDRAFADFDVASTGEGTFALTCVYRNSDGDVVGGIQTHVTASSCTASSDSFMCTD